MPPARFRLDTRAARKALAQAAAQERGGASPGGPGRDRALPSGITRSWEPPGDVHGSEIGGLLEWAAGAGVLAGVPGARVTYNFEAACCEEADDGYRFLLCLAAGAPAELPLAGPWHRLEDIAGAALRGPEAALEILREARDAANYLLGQLDRLRPPAAA